MTMLLTEASEAPAPQVLPVPHRVPRVNLLPPEVRQRRRVRTVQSVLAAGVAAVLCMVGLVYAAGAHDVHRAQAELDAANAHNASLQQQRARYADAPRIIALVDGARAARRSALATDVAWYQYLDGVSRATPGAVWLDTVSGAVTSTGASPASTPATPSAGSATATTPLAKGGIGTLTVTGKALGYEEVADYLDALATLHGVADPYLTTSASDDFNGKTVVAFTITAVVTVDALTHRFDQAGD